MSWEGKRRRSQREEEEEEVEVEEKRCLSVLGFNDEALPAPSLLYYQRHPIGKPLRALAMFRVESSCAQRERERKDPENRAFDIFMLDK